MDSEFLATTSIDGSARIWKAEDGFPLSTLERSGVCDNQSQSLHFDPLCFRTHASLFTCIFFLIYADSVQEENIELCRFSKDGTKPFLFCAAQRGILYYSEILLE